MSKYEHGGKGGRVAFTVVEVVVASTLLIISLALLLNTFVQTRRSAVISDNRLKAVQDARTTMEIALSYKYDDAQLSAGLHTNALVVSGVTNYYSYYVATVTQSSIVVKNIYVTNRWINPATRMTSTVSVAGSISYELHH